MSQIKKFFSKVKSEVKFATAGEGHRLSEPTTSHPPQPQSRPMSSAKPTAASGPAARAAGQAAQQRFQQQTSIQQSATASKNQCLLTSRARRIQISVNLYRLIA